MRPVLGSFIVRVWSSSKKLQMMLSVRMLNGCPNRTSKATDPTTYMDLEVEADSFNEEGDISS